MKILINQNNFKENHVRRKIDEPQIIDAKLVRIIGHCFFDGSVTIDGINYTNASQKLIRLFINDIYHVFRIRPSNEISIKKKTIYQRVFFNYRNLSKYLFEIAKTYSTSSPNCKIPKIIFELKQEYLYEFLRTFWEDEGCIKKSGAICGKTKSLTIAKQLIALHKKVKISTKLWKDRKNKAYDIALEINKYNLDNFIKRVGFKDSIVCRGYFKGENKIDVLKRLHIDKFYGEKNFASVAQLG